MYLSERKEEKEIMFEFIRDRERKIKRVIVRVRERERERERESKREKEREREGTQNGACEELQVTYFSLKSLPYSYNDFRLKLFLIICHFDKCNTDYERIQYVHSPSPQKQLHMCMFNIRHVFLYWLIKSISFPPTVQFNRHNSWLTINLPSENTWMIFDLTFMFTGQCSE